ncbi:hypothetical protein ABBQ38_007697 [Trebouxia sp. C0009 RCD-2024]
MTKRPVQYGVVDAPDADVAAAAPGFRAVWLSKDHLRDQLMQRGDVPKDAKLYFWDGELWLSWENPDDLPGPESDPLRIKVVRQQQAGAAEGQRAFSFHVASPDEDIDLVDVETNEVPVRSFNVSRNRQGKLFLDGIKEALANRGLVLLGIGEDGYVPAHKDGWTTKAFNTSPVQLIVGPKPGTYDATLVPIDFGYSFGTAVQVLPIPELMPFRLTCQMTGALQPHDALALLQAPCTLAMSALRSGKDILEDLHLMMKLLGARGIGRCPCRCRLYMTPSGHHECVHAGTPT